MAITITAAPKGVNRSVEAVTATFTVPVGTTSTAGSINSTAKIPANAQILGVNIRTNVIMVGGTNVTVKIGDAVGGAAVAICAAVVTADMAALLMQDVLPTVNQATLTAAAIADGSVSITTTGSYTAGDIDVTVFYVV